MERTPAVAHCPIIMQSDQYEPPDPTEIEAGKPEALDFWSRTLEVPPERIRQAIERAGPLLENVKRELGIAGV